MFLRTALALMIVSVIYAQGVKPLVAGYYSKHQNISKALEWDPDNSMLHNNAGKLVLAIERNNGDLTQYGLWTSLAINLAKQGNRKAAREATNKALWYYPDFKAAKQVAEALKK